MTKPKKKHAPIGYCDENGHVRCLGCANTDKTAWTHEEFIYTTEDFDHDLFCGICGKEITNKRGPIMTKQNAQQKHEAEVVELMKHAKEHADRLFGASSNVFAVEQIADFLEMTEDEDDLMADIERTVNYAKEVYGTETPTPEQAFGIFKRCFDTEG